MNSEETNNVVATSPIRERAVLAAKYEETNSIYMFATSPIRKRAVLTAKYEETNSGPIYTRDRSSVWTNLGKEKIVRPIVRLCINTGKQTDHPSRRTICIVRLIRRTSERSSSSRMIRPCV